MAHVIKHNGGRKTVLLNPAEKGLRYSRELRNNTNQKGESLTKDQRSYRSGYLDARRDNADAYSYNKAKANGTLAEWRAKKKARRARRSRSKKSN